MDFFNKLAQIELTLQLLCSETSLKFVDIISFDFIFIFLQILIQCGFEQSNLWYEIIYLYVKSLVALIKFLICDNLFMMFLFTMYLLNMKLWLIIY